jgi:RNA methyltransferase, TrmH family
MPPRIDSPKNPTVKALARLRERRHREREGLFLIEGAREVTRAAQAGVPLEQLLIAETFLGDEGRALLREAPADLKRFELSEAAFARLSLRQNPDGVLAVARAVPIALESLTLPEDALVLVIDGLEKPGNIGALLRTADAGDLAAVFLSGAGADLHNPNVIRSSVGSVFSRPVLAVPERDLLAFLRAGGFTLVAATPEAERAHWDEDYRGRTALLLGAEHAGLSAFWREEADRPVRIPMRGAADSLNVATAGAILIYEALRQRR